MTCYVKSIHTNEKFKVFPSTSRKETSPKSQQKKASKTRKLSNKKESENINQKNTTPEDEDDGIVIDEDFPTDVSREKLNQDYQTALQEHDILLKQLGRVLERLMERATAA